MRQCEQIFGLCFKSILRDSNTCTSLQPRLIPTANTLHSTLAFNYAEECITATSADSVCGVCHCLVIFVTLNIIFIRIHLAVQHHILKHCSYSVFHMLCVVSVLLCNFVITFRVSHRRREMYCGHARLCVCLSTAACLHYCTDADVTWRISRGCHLVVHYWTDLQSVQVALLCQHNANPRYKCEREMLASALYSLCA